MGSYVTPTVMFFPEEISGETIASEASVVTMLGAFAKGTTRLLLEWILLKGYEGEEHLQKFIARRLITASIYLCTFTEATVFC